MNRLLQVALYSALALARISQGWSFRSQVTHLNVCVFPFPCRIHIEEINHMVLLHMTEKMSYKHSEVLSAVLTNRASHTLAVYFLLNNKMRRLSKEYRVSGSPVSQSKGCV